MDSTTTRTKIAMATMKAPQYSRWGNTLLRTRSTHTAYRMQYTAGQAATRSKTFTRSAIRRRHRKNRCILRVAPYLSCEQVSQQRLIGDTEVARTYPRLRSYTRVNARYTCTMRQTLHGSCRSSSASARSTDLTSARSCRDGHAGQRAIDTSILEAVHYCKSRRGGFLSTISK